MAIEDESILGTAADDIITTTETKEGKILCPKCLAEGKRKLCNGQIGLDTHDDWAHNEEKRKKRLRAAARVGRERMLRNQQMRVAIPAVTPVKKGRAKAPPESRSQVLAKRSAYNRRWYARKKRRTAKGQVATVAVVSPNGIQPLQRAAKSAIPRVFQFWRDLEAVERALEIAQTH